MRKFGFLVTLVAMAIVSVGAVGLAQIAADDQAAAEELTANQKAWIDAKRAELLPQIGAHEQAIKSLRKTLERWEADVKKDRNIGPYVPKGK